MARLRPIFREDKAAQVASRFLRHEGGAIDQIKLVKLVYLADRLGLVRYGRPVTFDHFYSMPNGPVVSSTMDCINAVPEDDTAPYWARFIGPRDQNHRVHLLCDPETDQLSPVEEDLVDEVYENWGRMETWDLVRATHNLPEWEHPGPKKRTPLRYRSVLRAEGWSDDDITDLIQSLKAEVKAKLVLG